MLNNNLIRWVVGILIVVSLLTSLYSSYQFSTAIDDFSKSVEKISAPYKAYEQQREWIKESLTEDGYEVLSVSISNYSANAPFFEWYNIEDNTICDNSSETICYSDKVGVSVEMKSLGNRNEQIWDVLITMSSAYKNAFTYRMTIKSPTDTCDYIIFGKSVEDYFETYSSESRELIQYKIDNLKSCS